MKRLGCLLGAAAYGKRPQNRSENLFAPEPLSERRDVSAAPGWPPAPCDIRLRLRHRGKSRESCKSLLFFLSTWKVILSVEVFAILFRREKAAGRHRPPCSRHQTR